MSDPLSETGEHLQVAMDRTVEAREALEALEQDPGDGEVEEEDVWDSINSTLYDLDYALAKATWTAKDHMNQAADAAEEGYDAFVEDLQNSRKGLSEFREELSDSRPSKALHKWLQGLEHRLEGLLTKLKGDEDGKD